jgi:hypothetical protein
MYRDFLNRRLELESVGMAGITDGGCDNVPNISSPEAAAVIRNISPAMEASAQAEAIAVAITESTITDQTAIYSTQLVAPSLPPTVQPEDIAAAAVVTSGTLQVNLQIMPEGFGSYLDGILPKDLATAAGAFSATMQQIKNIRNIPIEKFAQVAATLETIRGLDLVNGTNVPTDTTEAEAALTLMALGSGPYGTYTFSDFFGCMSGLPNPWTQIQSAIIGLQSNTLVTIYQNLYLALTTSPPSLDTVVQSYIDAANAEIAIIRSTHPGQSLELNDMWDNLGTQLNIEQRARNAGLSIVPDPRTDSLFPYPIMVYSFTDLVPSYAKLTEPNMAAQTLEAISDLDINAGQSIVAMMRAERNKARLLEAGISTDDVIDDVLPLAEQIALISNGTVANSIPAFPFNTEPAGYFDPATTNFLVTQTPVITSPNQAVGPNNPTRPFNTTTPTNSSTNPSPNTIAVQPSIFGAPSPIVAAVLGIGTPNNTPIILADIGIGSPGISAALGGTVNNVAGTGAGAGGGGSLIAPEFFAGPGAGGGLGAQGGGPIVPGSLAGSPFTKLIPPALNPIYTSGVLLPASLPVQAAIEQVILCNCDCWIQ